jgi:hypothetical protein
MMDAFSYLSVVLSIILGFAITQILQGYRALLLTRAPVHGGWLSLVWSVLILLFVTQSWWASFGLRNHKEWTFLSFAAILLQMSLIYMMAAVVLPDAPPDTPIDLSDHFDRHRQAMFGFLVAILVTSVLKDLLVDGHWPTALNLAFHAMLAITALAGMWFTARWIQVVIVLSVSLGFFTYVITLFSRL